VLCKARERQIGDPQKSKSEREQIRACLDERDDLLSINRAMLRHLNIRCETSASSSRENRDLPRPIMEKATFLRYKLHTNIAGMREKTVYM
jgi:hypothetical protein